jgi:hypothetical protein
MGDGQGYRSMGVNMLDDNLNFGINIKYAGRILLFACIAGWYGMHLLNRLETVEEKLLQNDSQIRDLLDKHMVQERQERKELESRVKFYEKELNLNPFSWRKKKKK